MKQHDNSTTDTFIPYFSLLPFCTAGIYYLFEHSAI